jgi:hypothetical protein
MKTLGDYQLDKLDARLPEAASYQYPLGYRHQEVGIWERAEGATTVAV